MQKNSTVAQRVLAPKRPATPPPPKLSPAEIKKVERWVRKNVPVSSRGDFRK